MIKKFNVRKTYSVEYKLLAVKRHIEDGAKKYREFECDKHNTKWVTYITYLY